MLGFLDFTPVVSIDLGPLSISPHGIGTGLGIAAGIVVLLPATRRQGIDDELTFRLLTRAIVAAMIGARLAYVVNHAGDYLDDPLRVLRLWEGGFSLLGGIAAALLAILPEIRRHGLDFWAVIDAAAPGLALGIAVGRVGDLVVADHLGKPTEFFLGFRCPDADTASPCIAPVGHAVHQPALYDLVSALALFGFLIWFRRRAPAVGTVFLAFLTWYGTGRFVEDFFRIDDDRGFGLSASQWAVLTTVVVAVALLATGRRPRLRPRAPAPDH